jgi:glycosyltransferase involved in cell wall biosynthesis
VKLSPLTVTIITLNEEANLERCLRSVVSIASEIIVVDSGSTDRTLEIAQSFKARVFTNPWQGYGQQKNFAQSQATSEWILNLDADEEVSEALQREIAEILESQSNQDVVAFTAPRLSWYLGRWIHHGGWYPNRLARLYRKSKAQWSEPKVHEALIVKGEIGELINNLHHYPFSGIRDQIETNLRYAQLGSEDLQRRGKKFSLFWTIVKPVGKFIETYFIKLGFLDGKPGFIISVNAAHSIFLKYATLIEKDPEA